ncbi:class I SAM-dependent methyltransferase [Gloeothece verrucosa]|uniref:Methyltransferase type 11 n=1 Tax=Gloeothece verrucosa (strain PCC 7822) TaxID=497965 RepID=E0UJI5_GLOV7|nr:class I SAM-dependent methyltransferase [Gloeothece verrucosa]ADN17003.1 Methyltransferase type 11 [Gloeothece verrucosa PCC 7822]
MEKERSFPDWEQLYQQESVETMPWFHPELDLDVDKALSELNLDQAMVLDLGTGPGTQAMALAERGFNVIATDLSHSAIDKASSVAQQRRLEITWKQDDILNTQLGEQFDLILDRGCFHVLAPERRADYVQVVARLLKPSKYLFLKTFSVSETLEGGPYRFRASEIEELFREHFLLRSAQETVYYGTLDPLPRALFCILQRL